MSKRPHTFKNLVVEDGAVSEGTAKITVPKGEVFYNPVQQFNRDLSISVISAFQNMYLDEAKLKKRYPNKAGINIMEALSATGLRSIRYAKEIPNVDLIIANDLDPDAVELIGKNVVENLGPESKVRPNNADAITALHSFKATGQLFDVIDLDPYGSAVPFLDSAIANITDGGLLCITCTDTGVLCASYPETCYSKYGSIPLKGEISHEMALRILLSTTEATASRFKKYISPVLSCSIDFYIRVFVRVFDSPAESKKTCLRQSHIFRCVGCKSFEFQSIMTHSVNGRSEKFQGSKLTIEPRCAFCGSRKDMAGPIWNGRLHDRTFIEKIQEELPNLSSNFGTLDRIEGMLEVCKEELENPLYFSLNEVAHVLKSSCPPLLPFRSALLNAGYQVSISHCNPRAIKTNAPNSYFWAIMKAWMQQLTEKECKLDTSDDSIQRKILSLNLEAPVSFEKHPESNPPSRQSGLCRFPANPVANWGPLARARSSKIPKTEQ